MNRLTRLMSHLAVGATMAMALPTGSSAQVITFDGLSGPNQTPLTSYSEAGFTLSLLDGDLNHAFLVGNPIPSLYTFQSGTLSIVRTGGGQFRFLDVDLGSGSSGGNPTYTFEGYLASISLFTQSGTSVNTWANYASAYPDVMIDELRLVLGAGSASSINVDNISLSTAATTVPEPSTVVLLAVGALGLFLVRRRRIA